MSRKRITQKQWLELHIRQNGRCALSGVKFKPGDKIEVDHFIPVSLADKDGQIYWDKTDEYIDVNDIRNLRLVLNTEHAKKTKTDTKIAAKSKRIQAKNSGYKKQTYWPHKDKKKKVDGTVVWRDTEKPVGGNPS